MASKIGSGSRAGPLFVVVAIFLALLLDLGATSFSARRITLLIVMMAVLSVVGFSVATKIRNTELPKSNISFDSTASDVQRAGRASFTFPRGDAGTHGQAPSSINSAPLIAPIGIMDRLGAYLDSLVVVLNFEGRADLLARYMRPEYSLKSAVNIIVPGVVFDCCTINTTFLPPFVYGGREELLLYRSGYYESTIWTVFGLAQVMFGRLGGLGVLLVCGVVFGAVYVQLRASRWGVVLMPIFLFYGVYMFFMMQGLDAFFVDIQKFGLSMLVGFGLTYAFSRVGRVALRLRSRA